MIGVTFIVSILLSSICTADNSISIVYSQINKDYDASRPPLRVHMNGAVPTQVKSSNYHSKRCAFSEPGSAIQAYKSGVFEKFMNGQAVLVASPCLFSDSMGNWLSNYFETILCAKAAGMHYVSVAKVWEPSVNDTATPFIAHLPSIMPHARVKARQELTPEALLSACPCPSVCHERPNALWISNKDIIKPIMWGALNYHRSTLGKQSTLVAATDLSTSSIGSILPFIPDVAIHYRCGDNFVGHYGFLPFSAFKKFIPAKGTKTIYVLADKRSRKTAAKQHRAVKCDAIFSALFQYLHKNFPAATVVIRRGDDLTLDLIRLASARTTICSVSTFCLWPAFISNYTAYFPATKLVARGNVDLKMGFVWITEPKVVLGAPLEYAPTEKLVNLLSNS